MIYEIGEGTGLYCIEGAGARAYFIARPEPMLVDTGGLGRGDELVRDLARIGVQPIHVKTIILTHHHLGHVGGLPFIQRKSGARVYAHRGDEPYICGRLKRRSAKRPAERAFFSAITRVGFPDPRPVFVDRRLEDSEELNGWRVIHTPGHTPGHICLLKEGVLVSGDLLLATAGSFREMPPGSIADLFASRASIRRVAELSFDAILPAHNPPHIGNAGVKVQELASRFELS